jgi:hypothetical protein
MIWNFVLQRKKRSFRKEAIQKTVAALVESRGHGVISCKVRVTKSEGRRKIPRDEGADSVQYAWAAVNKDENISLDINGSFYKKDISTKAIFQFETGHENITKWLVIHFRWYNTKHPHLSGVWSEPQRLVIG